MAHQRQGDVGRAGPDACRGARRGRRAAQGPRSALRLLDDAAGLPRRRGGARHRRADQSARLHPRRQAPAQPDLPQRLRGRRLRRHPAHGPDAGACGGAEDGLHDRIDGDGDSPQHREPAGRPRAQRGRQLECCLPRRFRRWRRRLRGAAADPAPQCQLVVLRPLGALRQGRLREVLPAQDPHRQVRAVLRAPRAAGARHRQAQADPHRTV